MIVQIKFGWSYLLRSPTRKWGVFGGVFLALFWSFLGFDLVFVLVLAFFNKLLRQDAKFVFQLLTTLTFSYGCACLSTVLSFSESSACPQFTSVNLQGVCGWFPSALNSSSLQKNESLHPALSCSLSQIHMGLWETHTECARGFLSYRAELCSLRTTAHSPQNPHLQQNKTPTFLYLFGCSGLPCAQACSSTPCKFLLNQKCRDSKACTRHPHILLVLSAWQSDIWQKY